MCPLVRLKRSMIDENQNEQHEQSEQQEQLRDTVSVRVTP